jgi:hypothetical protein
MYQDMNCLQAWKVIPVNALVGTPNIIRNKVLNFALEIKVENPEAGDAPINSIPILEDKVNHIFNTYISGHVQNVSTGGKNIIQNAKIESNPEKLIDALVNANADSEVTKNLTGTVEEMMSTVGTKEFVSHYHNFMSIMADNIQVYGSIVAPFLPALTSYFPNNACNRNTNLSHFLQKAQKLRHICILLMADIRQQIDLYISMITFVCSPTLLRLIHLWKY